jgi:hypothetical protein
MGWDFARIMYCFLLSSMGQEGVGRLLKIISNTETNLKNTMGCWCAISFDEWIDFTTLVLEET